MAFFEKNEDTVQTARNLSVKLMYGTIYMKQSS